MTLSASAMYACTVLLSKKAADVPPAFVVLMQTFVGALLVLPFVDFSSVPTTPSQWGYICVLGVVHTFLLYCLVFSAYQKLSVNSIAVLSFIYPLSAIAFDYAVYGHVLTATQCFGVALILLGIIGVKVRYKPIALWRAVSSKE